MDVRHALSDVPREREPEGERGGGGKSDRYTRADVCLIYSKIILTYRNIQAQVLEDLDICQRYKLIYANQKMYTHNHNLSL